MTPKEIAFKYEILRGLVGSTAHGTGIEGQEDRDEMGIFIEPPENVMGLTSVDHYIHRTQSEGMPSGPGDLDLTYYSLRKFMKLAASGNPSVIVLLWLPDYLKTSQQGVALVEMRQEFITHEMGKRFLGYLRGQKSRLLNQRAVNVTRPDLIEKYGYDTKSAMHAARLAFQGLELIRKRHLTMPVPEPERSILLDIRHGQLNLASALQIIENTEDDLRIEVDKFERRANRSRIDRFLVTAHQHYWGDMFL